MPLNAGNFSCVFNFTLPNTTPGAVVRHVSTSLAPTLTVLQDIADAIENWWTTDDAPVVAARQHFHQGLILQNVTLTQMVGAPQLQLVHVIASAGAGTGDAPPNESALVNKWNTGFPGRAFRGRSFWPGYKVDNLDGTGIFSAAFVTAFTGCLDRLQADVNAASDVVDSWSLYSRSQDDFIAISSNTVRAVPHHQTRRNS